MDGAAPRFKSALTGPVGQVEPRFLHAIDADRMVGAVMALAAELYILRDRQDRIERLLTDSGALAPGAVEGLVDDAPASAVATREAEAFARRILGELLRGEQPGSRIGRFPHPTHPEDM